jgi:hypothetical protein
MNELNISFSLNGSVKQKITILNGDEPKKFFKKMKMFSYLTSLSGSEILDLNDNMKVVGTIDDQYTNEETEFFDFEMEE